MQVVIEITVPDPKFKLNDQIVVTATWRKPQRRGQVISRHYGSMSYDPDQPKTAYTGNNWSYECQMDDGTKEHFGSHEIDLS